MGLKDRLFSRAADAPPPLSDSGDVPTDASDAVDDTTMILPAGALGPATRDAPSDASGDQPTQVLMAADPPPADADALAEAPAPELPDPAAAIPAQPGWRDRGRLRRRLAYLREVRELGYRDLGGLVFDQHRFQRPNDGLIQGKVLAIDAVDRELRAIEVALRERLLVTELALPGLSACQRCGALHGSDARYCPQCGLAFAGPRTIAGIGDVNAPYGQPVAGPGQAALFDPSRAPAAATVEPPPGTPPGP